ncbi:MAG TPA: Uma2 family endonuclease [Anaerolineae bacterium]|nr:Uma2 family endonuclease [Anaerolineae bacterium]
MAVQAPTQPPAERQWPPPQGQWTYDDYKRLPDDGWRYEVLEGELLMTAAPSTKHQRTSLNLSSALHQHVTEQELGEVYTAPIDVILPDLASPVQPDILFIARERLSIVKEDSIEGPPDLIVEILSPSNWLADRRTKFRVYALAGVREYWIVDTDTRSVEVFVLRGSSFAQVGKFGPGETVRSEVVAGFAISVDDICPA